MGESKYNETDDEKGDKKGINGIRPRTAPFTTKAGGD